jgi:hypothetical protein
MLASVVTAAGLARDMLLTSLLQLFQGALLCVRPVGVDFRRFWGRNCLLPLQVLSGQQLPLCVNAALSAKRTLGLSLDKIRLKSHAQVTEVRETVAVEASVRGAGRPATT